MMGSVFTSNRRSELTYTPTLRQALNEGDASSLCVTIWPGSVGRSEHGPQRLRVGKLTLTQPHVHREVTENSLHRFPNGRLLRPEEHGRGRLGVAVRRSSLRAVREVARSREGEPGWDSLLWAQQRAERSSVRRKRERRVLSRRVQFRQRHARGQFKRVSLKARTPRSELQKSSLLQSTTVLKKRVWCGQRDGAGSARFSETSEEAPRAPCSIPAATARVLAPCPERFTMR